MAGFKTVGDYMELDKFQNEISPLLDKNMETIQNKIKISESQCLNKYNDNEQGFMDCMKKLNKVIQKQQNRFDYGILYWRQWTYKCFALQGQGKKDFDQCKPQSKQLLSDIFESFKL